LASFFRREDGKLVLDERCHPIADFSQATDEQLRTLTELSYDANGRPKLKLHDPKPYLRARQLLSSGNRFAYPGECF